MAQDDGPRQLTPKERHEKIIETLKPSVIAEPLKSEVDEELASSLTPGQSAKLYQVIIELNTKYPGTRDDARRFIEKTVKDIVNDHSDKPKALERNQPGSTHPYVFAQLTAVQIKELVRQDGEFAKDKDREITAKKTTERESQPQTEQGQQIQAEFPKPVAHRHLRAIFRVWEAQKVYRQTTESIRTVKADAAQVSFGASGKGIVWAVLDSGVDATHPHFKTYDTLLTQAPLCSMSFLANCPWDQDPFGHGTHVAGIISGAAPADPAPKAAVESTNESGGDDYHLQDVSGIKGMAPQCKLLILRVLDDNGVGDEISLIDALEHIQKLNDYGRNLVVHGVNISAGFWSDPKWYACGQTPLCMEVDRLVRSGVVVVAAAGNSGDVITVISQEIVRHAGQTMSINDPGNAGMAITVGSTHREKPHIYGVSYFSSKGPTSDGRQKPEVLAPGERIISCASSQRYASAQLGSLPSGSFSYVEDTGTSMAAPHVSGILASFLSIRREFVGRTTEIRSLITNSATDLGRDRNAQGTGLVDLMRLIQAV